MKALILAIMLALSSPVIASQGVGTPAPAVEDTCITTSEVVTLLTETSNPTKYHMSFPELMGDTTTVELFEFTEMDEGSKEYFVLHFDANGCQIIQDQPFFFTRDEVKEVFGVTLV